MTALDRLGNRSATRRYRRIAYTRERWWDPVTRTERETETTAAEPSVELKARRWPVLWAEPVQIALAICQLAIASDAPTSVLVQLAHAQVDARRTGQLTGAARWMPAGHPLLPVFAQPRPDDVLLGYVDEESVWHPGVAGLVPQEAQAVRMYSAGMGLLEMSQEMTRARLRSNRSMWIKIETVERYLRGGLAKLKQTLDATVGGWAPGAVHCQARYRLEGEGWA